LATEGPGLPPSAASMHFTRDKTAAPRAGPSVRSQFHVKTLKSIALNRKTPK